MRKYSTKALIYKFFILFSQFGAGFCLVKYDSSTSILIGAIITAIFFELYDTEMERDYERSKHNNQRSKV